MNEIFLPVSIFPSAGCIPQCFLELLLISVSRCAQARRFLLSSTRLGAGIEFLHLCPLQLSPDPSGDTLHLLNFTSLSLSTSNMSTSISPSLP